MQKPPIVNDHNNQFDTSTLTILNLQQEVTKLSSKYIPTFPFIQWTFP